MEKPLRMPNLTAKIGRDEDIGVYVSYCPEIGIASQGKTSDDALSNLREAVSLYVEEGDMEMEEIEAMEVDFA